LPNLFGNQHSSYPRSPLLELALAVSAIDSHGRTIWIADATRSDGKRFIVRVDEKLTAFLELESAIRDVRRIP